MAKIIIKNSTEPSTPTSGETSVYIDSTTKKLASKDDTGTVTDYGSGGGDDELVKISSNDTTAGYIEDKIVAGTGISIATLNDGSNETFQITSTVTNTDQLVKVSANDTTAGFLEAKIVAGTNVTVETLNDGSNETFRINASGGSSPSLDTEVLQAWFWQASSSFANITPMNFVNVSSGTGSGVTARTVTNEADIAEIRIDGGTAGNSFAALYAAMPSVGQMLFSTLDYTYTFHIRIERLGNNASDRVEVQNGFANSRAAAAPSRCILGAYESNVSDNFILRTTGPGSVSTVVITDIPVVAGTLYKMAVRFFSDGGTPTAQLYIGDVLKASSTTNLPDQGQGFLHKCKSLNASGPDHALSLVKYASFKAVF